MLSDPREGRQIRGIRPKVVIEEARSKIRTSVLVQRLCAHALGQVEMNATQVRAAEILLRKVIPDLAAIDHTGEVTQRFVLQASEPSQDFETWSRQQLPTHSVQ